MSVADQAADHRTTHTGSLASTLDEVRSAYRRNPLPSAEERIDRLRRLNDALLRDRDKLVSAVDQDFGGRHQSETFLAELIPLLDAIRYHSKHIPKWMRPDRRRPGLTLRPAQISVHYQPVGVVGIVSPWNFPLFLALSPLIGAWAAGNSAMLKLSEHAPQTADALREMLERTFDTSEVVVVTGGPDIAAEFTSLPFDHLVFTGSTSVGRKVMAAAAENLTPVTLELGGKSPAIIHESYSAEEAASRLAWGKCINAGQVCVSPDYVLCPEGSIEEFCREFLAASAAAYPEAQTNPDYTSIINDRQADRLTGYIDDARAKGATVHTAEGVAVEGAPAEDVAAEGSSRRLPMTVLTDVTPDMTVMQDEIFGPILPVIGYRSLDDALAFVNDRPRPLALYYFDADRRRAKQVLAATHSGGVCINDTMSHVLADDLPFGGIGPSGMGHYHGREGFLNFSKAKPVLRRGRLNPALLIGPPWGRSMYNAFMAYQWRRLRPYRRETG